MGSAGRCTLLDRQTARGVRHVTAFTRTSASTHCVGFCALWGPGCVHASLRTSSVLCVLVFVLYVDVPEVCASDDLVH